MSEITRSEVEQLLNMRIRNLSFYREALIHKSAMKLYNAPRSNERLEFIGDAVLNLVITKYVYNEFPKENEGYLTKIRMKLVSGKSLSAISKTMKINNSIRMNAKALKQNWNNNDRILEDTLEALIGALYLDMGMYHVSEFITRNIIDTQVNLQDFFKDNNYKDILMRFTQTNNWSLPHYTTMNEHGPDHKKIFNVRVIVNNETVGEGQACVKKQAEQLAAKNALSHFKINF